MHFSGTAYPWRGSCRQARLSWHAALLLSSLRLAAVESYKPPGSSSDTTRCQTSQAQHAHVCMDAAPASSEAVSKVLLQRSASLASPHRQKGNSLKDVMELARSKPPEEEEEEEEDDEEEDQEAEMQSAAVENDSANDEVDKPKQEDRRRKSGESSLDTDRETRPHSGNKSETIEFGVYLKDLHGINFGEDTFSCDLVLTLRWFDKRARKVLQDDEESATMPTALAKTHIWLPDIAVTNRALKGFDIISSSVTVSASGQVSKTERMFVVVLAAFDVRSFPFDTQMLHVRVASTSYMANELQLSVLETPENPDTSGLQTDIFNISGFSLNSVKAETFEETDGSLRKSRGSLDISITRDWMPLVFSCLVPNMLLLLTSWSVFFFPMQTAFVMPRVSTSLISLLSSMTLAVKTSRLLPAKRSGDVWIEYFEETCQTMMFITVCLNILVELIHHEWTLVALATKITDELRYGYGCLICLMGSFWFWAYLRRDAHTLQFGPFFDIDADGMSPVVLTTRVILFMGLLLYFVFTLTRVQSASKQVEDNAEVTREHLAAAPRHISTY